MIPCVVGLGHEAGARGKVGPADLEAGAVELGPVDAGVGDGFGRWLRRGWRRETGPHLAWVNLWVFKKVRFKFKSQRGRRRKGTRKHFADGEIALITGSVAEGGLKGALRFRCQVGDCTVPSIRPLPVKPYSHPSRRRDLAAHIHGPVHKAPVSLSEFAKLASLSPL